MPDVDVFVLPWWAGGYLCAVYGFSAAGVWDEIKNDPVAAVGAVMSLACITIFVISYFNPGFALHFGGLFFPMVLIGVAWEFSQAVLETGRAQVELEKEADLNDDEKNFLVNVAAGMNALLVVPGYAVGVKLCYDMLAGIS